MGLTDMFARIHGKPKWTELEPWHKFLIGIELMMLPFALLFLVEMLAGRLIIVDLPGFRQEIAMQRVAS